MNWVIGVTHNNEKTDSEGRNTKSDILDIELPVERVKTMHVYFVTGKITEEEIEKTCEELFADSVIQTCKHSEKKDSLSLVEEKDAWIIQVKNKKGVTDAVAESAKKAMKLLGINGIEKVQTAKTYTIKGRLTEEQIKTISEKILANTLIQNYEYVRA